MTLSKHNAVLSIQDAANGVVVSQGPKRRKVAIVGFEEAYYKTAPYDDPSYEIWGFNHANRLDFMRDTDGALRADRWFDLHEQKAQSAADMEWIKTCPVPIYLTDLYGGNPMAVRYPINEVIEATGSRYFCSSFAYALVLACMEGFEVIELHGMNLNYGRELAVERGNLNYWIARMEGLGHTIDYSFSPMLCNHPYLYGFEYDEEREWVERRMGGLVYELMQDERVRDLVCSFLSERFTELAHRKDNIRGMLNELETLAKESIKQ